jgi:hypothetical protein
LVVVVVVWGRGGMLIGGLAILVVNGDWRLWVDMEVKSQAHSSKCLSDLMVDVVFEM